MEIIRDSIERELKGLRFLACLHKKSPKQLELVVEIPSTKEKLRKPQNTRKEYVIYQLASPEGRTPEIYKISGKELKREVRDGLQQRMLESSTAFDNLLDLGKRSIFKEMPVGEMVKIDDAEFMCNWNRLANFTSFEELGDLSVCITVSYRDFYPRDYQDEMPDCKLSQLIEARTLRAIWESANQYT